MKKITLMLFALVALCMQSNAQIFIQENLDSGYPSGWTQSSYFTSTTSAYLCEGTGNVADNMYSSAANDGTITSSNYVGVSNGTDTTVTFQWLSRPYLANAVDYIIYVEYSTDDGANWNSISTFAVTAQNPCTTYSEVIPAASLPIGSDFKFQIRGEWQSGDSYFYLDDIFITQVIACPQPSTLTATPTSLTDANITWVAEGTETDWTYEYGVSPYTQGGGGTSGSVMTTPSLNLMGLTAGETYDIYIQANCGGGDGDSAYVTTSWTQPVVGQSCITPIAATVEADCSTATPITIDFATAPDIGPAGSCDTTTGNEGAWLEFTAPASGAILLTNTTTSVEYVILDACGGTEVACGDLSASNEIGGLTPSAVYKLALWKDTGSGSGDFCLSELTCLAPSALTATNITDVEAELGWTENGTATSWNIEWGNDGFTQGSGTVESGVTNSYILTGLMPTTDYEYYVQADCTGGDLSAWVGPFSFTTACPASFLPEYNADMSVNAPDCWEEATNGDIAGGPMGLGSGSWIASNHNGTPSNRINLYSNFHDDWIISPVIDLSTAAPSELNVYVALTENTTSGSGADLGSDDSVDLLMTTDGGTTWTSMQSWTQGNVPTDVGEEITYDLSAITGTVQFAFYASEGTVNDPEDVYFHVSKFQVRETPACPEPSGLTATATSTSEATITWTAGGSETDWTYEYGVSPYSQGGGGTSGTVMTTPSLDLTGLTPGETYDFYVQANCGGSDSIYITVSWTQPNIGELCAEPISANVETDCSTATPVSLDFDNGGSEVLPSCDTSGNNGYWVEVTSPVNGSMSINLGGTATSVGVAIYDACGGTEVFCANNNLGASTSLTGLMGSTTYYLYFWQDSASGIAEVCFEEINCVFPSSLDATVISATEVDISWVENNSPAATAWEYVVQAPGAGAPAGAGTATTSNPTSLTGLTDGTSYEFYVRANCGGSFSEWSGPFTFSTPCSTTSVPYMEDFNSSTDIGCGSVVNDGAGNTWGVVSTTSYGFTPNHLRYSWNSSNAADTWYFTQGLNLTGGTSYVVSYDYGGTGATFPEALRVSYGTANNSAAMTTELANYPSVTNDTPLTENVAFTPPADGIYYIGFQAYSNANQFYLHLDNISVNLTLSTTEVENEAAFTYYPNPVKNTLTLNAQNNNIENVTMYNMLGQEVLRATPNTIDSDIDMSGLQTGTYFVRVTIANITKTIRIIKQ